MSANTAKIESTLAAGSPPPAVLTGGAQHRGGNITVMATVSRKELLTRLDIIGTFLKAAELYCQQSDIFQAEQRIKTAEKHLDKLVKAVSGDNPALHDELCGRAPGNTGR